jgi:phosphoserine/homoserine phosphotransferase
MNFEVIAFGDSYNDINMLLEADQGVLFRPPQNVVNDYPDFPVLHEYSELKCYLENWM